MTTLLLPIHKEHTPDLLYAYHNGTMISRTIVTEAYIGPDVELYEY